MKLPIALFLAASILGACDDRTRGDEEARENNAVGAVAPAPTQHLGKVPLVVTHAHGGETKLMLEIALTAPQQERGLMNRRDLGARDGMVFPMIPPRTPNFWMKDTHVPLDLLFIRTDGTIGMIAHGKPDDLTPISTGAPMSGAIELKGGAARALGIREGDSVAWGACALQAAATPVAEPENFCPA